MDSGLRRNDGWGSRNDGECGRTAWIPACAGMVVGGRYGVGMVRNAALDSGLRRNDGCGSRQWGRQAWIPACAGMTGNVTARPGFRLAPG